MRAPLPPNETQRVQALRAYDILDSEPEDAFDRAARMAATMFGVPIALISLVDRDRQWLKSCFGVDVRETSRDIAFCAHAILSDNVFVVEDATQDERFATNPLVTGELGIRFYAGAPLRSRDGYNLGTLCVIDTKPRTFSPAEATMLTDMAAFVVDEMELRRLLQQQRTEISDLEHARDTLRISERHFRSLIENAQDIITILDPSGTIVYESPSLEHVFGYKPVELIGRNAFEFVHPDDVEHVVASFQEAAQDPQHRSLIEFRFRHWDGSWRILEAIGSVSRHGSVISGIVVNSRDVTERRRAEEALRESELRFRAASDGSFDSFYILKSVRDENSTIIDFEFVDCNTRGAEMVSSTKSQIIGKRLCELFPINRTAGFLEKYAHVVESGEALDEEFSIVAPHIQASWLHHQVIRLGDGIAITSHDITQRKHDEDRLRESEARKAAILETALDCIITIDHTAHVTEFNPAAERTFGYSRQEAVGRPLHELIVPPQYHEAHCRGIAHYLETGEGPVLNKRLELPAMCADGSQITVELAITSIPGKSNPSFTAYLRDITQRKQDERALQEAKEEAEAANRAKSEFLSRMSHELRTPLNAILGFGQLLEMDELDAMQTESVEQIMHAGQHLLGLINEVLDLSRIESGRIDLSLEPVDLCEVLCEALDLVSPIAARHNIRLHDTTGGCSGHVMADRQRLKQVLLNLLTNAVKYNRPGGSVTLSCTDETTGRLRILVQDEGQGIAADKIERLFLPFERLGAERSAIEGTGLGLVLSQRLMQAMDSTIEVSSTQGEGSTFSFVLPLVAGQLETTPLPEHLEDDAAGDDLRFHGAVLYIEDNGSNLRLVERVVKQRPGLKLMAAIQGDIGVELALQHKPDLILLDLHLPDMSGDEVLRRLRQHDDTRDIPVAVISADATPGRVQRLLDAGVNHYLTKPLDVRQFLQLLDEHLSPDYEEGTESAQLAETVEAVGAKKGADSEEAVTVES